MVHDAGNWSSTEHTPVVVAAREDSDPNQSMGASPINHQFLPTPNGLLELLVFHWACVVKW